MSVSFSDVRVVARAAVVLVWVRRSLRDSTYHEVRELLANRLSSDGEEAGNRDRFDEARRVGQLVNGVANKLPLDLNCVPRTLTTWYLLGRRGIIADMPIGVRTSEDSERVFHTWAEVNGIPVNDRRDVATRYTLFGTDLASVRRWEP